MAKPVDPESYSRPLRRLLLGITVLFLVGLALLWRIDNPRAERLRANLVDRFVPNMEWAFAPVTALARMAEGFEGYTRVYEQNQELRRELQSMRAWREIARQLEQENARLLDLNQVVLSPRLTFVSGLVLSDAGSPFRHSVLLNIGAQDGLKEGWAAMDGLGLVGRLSGVGTRSARVLLVTDSNSHVPVTIQPSGRRAILTGDTSNTPLLDFLERSQDVQAGQRVVTSGDGGVFPPDLLVGTVAQDAGGSWRVRLAADIERLEFLRVIRAPAPLAVETSDKVVGALRSVPEDGLNER